MRSNDVINVCLNNVQPIIFKKGDMQLYIITGCLDTGSSVLPRHVIRK